MAWDSEKGEVNGPSSSTDNAIPRFSGTSGDTLENSTSSISDSGNMGVGVNPASDRLHVMGTGTTKIKVESSGGSNTGYVLKNTAIEVEQTVNSFGDLIWNNLTAGAVRMKMQSSGKLAIGPHNPTEILDVLGNAKISGGLGIGDNPTAKLDVKQTTDGNDGVNINCATGSYASNCLTVTCDRGDSSAYNLIEVRNDEDGSAQVRLVLDGDGNLQLGAYGAGTLVTDSSGNITASSDASLKTNIEDFTTGLDAIKNLRAVKFNWNEDSGYNQDDLNVGFIAQEVESHIPEAIGQTAKGTKTLSDRAIICALLNSVKELSQRVEALEAGS